MRLQTLQSQRGIPSQTGLQGPDPRAAGLVGGAVADLGETAVRLTTALTAQRAELQQATDLFQARSALQTVADETLKAASTDTDYRTMEARYPERFDTEVERVLGNVTDPRVKLAAKQRAFELRTNLTASVRSQAVALQTSDFKASLEASLFEDRQAAATATPEAREAILTGAARKIDAGVLARALTPEEGVKRKLTLIDEVAETQALVAIDADPYGAEKALRKGAGDFALLKPKKRVELVESAQRAQRSLEAEETRREAKLAKARQDREEARELDYLLAFEKGSPLPFKTLEADLKAKRLTGDVARRVTGYYTAARKEPRQSDPEVKGALEYQIATGADMSIEAIGKWIGPDGLTSGDAATLVKALKAREDFSGDPQYQMGRTVLDVLRPSEFTATPEQRVFYAQALSEWQLAWRGGRRTVADAETIRDRYLGVMRRARFITKGLAQVPSRFQAPLEAYEALQRREISDEEFNTEIERFRREAEAEERGERTREGRRGAGEGTR